MAGACAAPLHCTGGIYRRLGLRQAAAPAFRAWPLHEHTINRRTNSSADTAQECACGGKPDSTRPFRTSQASKAYIPCLSSQNRDKNPSHYLADMEVAAVGGHLEAVVEDLHAVVELHVLAHALVQCLHAVRRRPAAQQQQLPSA